MTLPSKVQRFLFPVWPVLLLIGLPIAACEAVNLWRKNRIEFSKSRS